MPFWRVRYWWTESRSKYHDVPITWCTNYRETTVPYYSLPERFREYTIQDKVKPLVLLHDTELSDLVIGEGNNAVAGVEDAREDVSRMFIKRARSRSDPEEDPSSSEFLASMADKELIFAGQTYDHPSEFYELDADDYTRIA